MSMTLNDLPICVLVLTKNEESNIGRCLDSVDGFSYVAVIDSHSDDRTTAIAREKGAHIISFRWNGQYPKKRQWCLDTLALPYDWVLWLDADEVLTAALISEIRDLFTNAEPRYAGFFIRGQYVINGKVLRYGLRNNKIALMNKREMMFPVVDDLGAKAMGEMEGHYQPLLRDKARGSIGQIRAPLLHYSYEDHDSWRRRHERYALWEAYMLRHNVTCDDPVMFRRVLKTIFRLPVLKGVAQFIYSYILRFGFLDGAAGFYFAKSRFSYGLLIRNALRML